MTAKIEDEIEVYRRRAGEVEALAAARPFADDREALLKIAAEWRRLAAQAERRRPPR